MEFKILPQDYHYKIKNERLYGFYANSWHDLGTLQFNLSQYPIFKIEYEKALKREQFKNDLKNLLK